MNDNRIFEFDCPKYVDFRALTKKGKGGVTFQKTTQNEPTMDPQRNKPTKKRKKRRKKPNLSLLQENKAKYVETTENESSMFKNPRKAKRKRRRKPNLSTTTLQTKDYVKSEEKGEFRRDKGFAARLFNWVFGNSSTIERNNKTKKTQKIFGIPKKQGKMKRKRLYAFYDFTTKK